ncbi:hypothetical protein GF356_13250, partial [candidate division GN15 bacterium]|nr:hypothetical protein [candidate division GN15 bacterium]
MKTHRLFLIACALCLLLGVQASAMNSTYVKNEGQWPDSVLFRGSSGP